MITIQEAANPAALERIVWGVIGVALGAGVITARHPLPP
jgi:hypothetical protein